jgi:hypothetical protein
MQCVKASRTTAMNFAANYTVVVTCVHSIALHQVSIPAEMHRVHVVVAA